MANQKQQSFPLFLYNTLHRSKIEFVPLDEKMKSVGMYTCGPTVYSFAHIGNLRAYLFEDILKRTLTYNGYKVKHVMNITDVGHLTDDADSGEDKVEQSAAREGRTAWEIAEKYTAAFKKDLHELNIIAPDLWCKATDHIEDQIALIQRLEQKGFTYRTGDGIYYDTSKFPSYGQLAQLKIKGLDPGRRVKLSEDKRNPTDFALWKFSPSDKKRQMEWDSPWGKGFPGWHIECSAMSMRYLGEEFDIHCGGIDHIPVHHTNEIAQVEAVTGRQWVRYWLHGEFLLLAESEEGGKAKKMAKSEGNILTLQVLQSQGYHPLAFRYFLLNAHYRKQLLFRDDAMQAAQNGFNNFCNCVSRVKEEAEKSHPKETSEEMRYKEAFTRAINDDLNMPQGLAVAWEVLHDKNLPPGAVIDLIEDFDRVLGLKAAEEKAEVEIPPEIQKKIEEREAARLQKNWGLADRLRYEIREVGYEVMDTKAGVKVRKLTAKT